MGEELTNTIVDAVKDEAIATGEEVATGFFARIFEFYNSFITVFPEQYQWIVSVVIILAIAGGLWNLVRKNWMWLILLVVIFPGILPVLQNIFNSLSKMLIGSE